MNKCKFKTILGVMVLSCLINIQSSSAEEVEDFVSLPARTLLEQTLNAMAAVQMVRERRVDLADRITALEGELRQVAIDAQTFDLPEPPAMTHRPTSPEAVQDLMDRWQARATALETLQGLIRTRQSLTEQHQETALLLAEELSVLEDARAQAQPLLAEVLRRREEGSLAADEIPSGLDEVPSRSAPGDLVAEAEGYRSTAARDQVILTEARDRLGALEDERDAAATVLAQVADWLGEATERVRLAEAFSAMDAADLLGSFNGREADLATARDGFLERLSALDNALAGTAEAVAALEALAPPSAEDVAPAVPSETDALRKARSNLALAEAMVAFRTHRLTRLQSIASDKTDQAAATAGLVEAAGPLLAEHIALEVLAEVLTSHADVAALDLPAAVTDGSLTHRTETMRRRVKDLEARRTALDEEAEALVDTTTAAETALTEARTTVEAQALAVQREEQWASFIAEMQDLSLQELRAAFDQAVRAVATSTALLETVREQTATIETAVAEARAAYRNHYNPVVLAKRGQDDAFHTWLRDQGLRRTPPPAETTTGEADAAAPQAEPRAPAPPVPAESDVVPSPVQTWVSTERKRRDEQVVRRLQYYRDHASLRDEFRQALESQRTQLTGERESTETALTAARRAWGSATMLQSRLAQTETDDAALTEAIAPWLDRAPVLDLQDQAAALDARLQTAIDAIEALTRPPGEAEIEAALAAWDEQASLVIEQLSEFLSLRNQAAALDDIDALDELERRMLDRAVEDRIARDLGVTRELGYYFGTQESGTIDELLERYYQRLVVLDRQVENLERRQATLEAVAVATEKVRPVIAPIAELLDAQVAEASLALEREVTLTKAALSPAEAPTILVAFTEATGQPMDPGAIPQLPTDDDEDVIRTARENLLEGLRDDWAQVAGLRTWTANIQAQTQPLGEIDDRIGQYRDLLAALESTKAERQRTIARLVGYEPAELNKLVATGAAGDRERLSLGEIGLLQRERTQLLQWRMVESGISLFVIPIVALVLILLVRGVSRGLVARATRADSAKDQDLSESKQRERAMRVRTLASIFQTVTSSLIVILAGIYMLKVINIDVTPIIASLGVFGLAVAFGAQAIMRDVFAGFFILLENQLNRGDWVTINGLVGQVEEIGLRLTVIRDFTDGQLHFIPNGTIAQVSNYSKLWSRVNVRISTDYEVDPQRVYDILKRTADAMKADPRENANIHDINMAPAVAGIDFDAGCLNFGVFVDVRNADFGVAWRYRMKAKAALEAEGIRLALPKRIEITGPETIGTTAELA